LRRSGAINKPRFVVIRTFNEPRFFYIRIVLLQTIFELHRGRNGGQLHEGQAKAGSEAEG